MEIRMVSKKEHERIALAVKNTGCCCESVTIVGNTYYIGISPERVAESLRPRLEETLCTNLIVLNGVTAPAR